MHMLLSLVTIGQAPRVDITAELDAYLRPGVGVVEFGALDGLDPAELAAIAPREGEGVLTSRLCDGGSAVFGHDHAVPLIQRAITRGEDAGADATVLLCAGDFPTIEHSRPLFLSERLSDDGQPVHRLAGGDRRDRRLAGPALRSGRPGLHGLQRGRPPGRGGGERRRPGGDGARRGPAPALGAALRAVP